MALSEPYTRTWPLHGEPPAHPTSSSEGPEPAVGLGQAMQTFSSRQVLQSPGVIMGLPGSSWDLLPPQRRLSASLVYQKERGLVSCTHC